MPTKQRTTSNSNSESKKNSRNEGVGKSGSQGLEASQSEEELRGTPSQKEDCDEGLAELKNRIAVLHKELVQLESELVQSRNEQHEAFSKYAELAYKTQGIVAPVVLCLMVLGLSVSAAILIRNAVTISRLFSKGFSNGMKALFSGAHPLQLKIAFAAALPLLVLAISLALYVTCSGYKRRKALAEVIDNGVEKYNACYELQTKISYGQLALQSAMVSVTDTSIKQLQFVQQGILMCAGELDDMHKFRLRLDNEINDIQRRIPGVTEEIKKHTDEALEWNLARTKSILEGTEGRLREMGNELARYLDDVKTLIDDARNTASATQNLIDSAVQRHISEVISKVAEVSEGFVQLRKSVSHYLQKSEGLVAQEVKTALDSRMTNLQSMYKLWNCETNSVDKVCKTLVDASTAIDAIIRHADAKKCLNAVKYDESSTQQGNLYDKILAMSKAIAQAVKTYQARPAGTDEANHCRNVLRTLDNQLFGSKGVFKNEDVYAAFIKKAMKCTEDDQGIIDTAKYSQIVTLLKNFTNAQDGFFVFLPYLTTSSMAIDHMRVSIEHMTGVCERLAALSNELFESTRIPEEALGASTNPPDSHVTNVAAQSAAQHPSKSGALPPQL
ncbi:hypothetical protein [Anaplasma capra]|uniref:hypothetical protein n=1 Tax=Anaplasma capra TaxID=1562740 RepID=UPI0021D59D63|nr:hypothetical protein [Anaplasma capra]MCU7611234.1 hypothetical protein [Anaplasma capra]MCU7612606.1 hypothetical protein [Anaplasma capra]